MSIHPVLVKVGNCHTSMETEQGLSARKFVARGKQKRPSQKIGEGGRKRQQLKVGKQPNSSRPCEPRSRFWNGQYCSVPTSWWQRRRPSPVWESSEDRRERRNTATNLPTKLRINCLREKVYSSSVAETVEMPHLYYCRDMAPHVGIPRARTIEPQSFPRRLAEDGSKRLFAYQK